MAGKGIINQATFSHEREEKRVMVLMLMVPTMVLTMLLIMIMLIIMVMFLLSMMIILLKHIVHSIINYAEDYAYAHFFTICHTDTRSPSKRSERCSKLYFA